MTDEPAKFWEGLTIENYDWREADQLSLAFVDLFLLSLIRAHPIQTGKEYSDFERLRDAKKALFGIKPKDDLKESRDFPILVDMAREYISDRGGAEYIQQENRISWGDHDDAACRGIKPLARDVVQRLKEQGEKFDPMVEEESVVARLARKFRKHQNDLVVQVVIHGNLETGFMVGWIDQARDLFGPFMIPVADAGDPVRDLKTLF